MARTCSTPCRCQERMGNDFWFLPADRCLYDADAAVRMNNLACGLTPYLPPFPELIFDEGHHGR